MGIEPTSSAWKAVALPLSYARIPRSNTQHTGSLASPSFESEREGRNQQVALRLITPFAGHVLPQTLRADSPVTEPVAEADMSTAASRSARSAWPHATDAIRCRCCRIGGQFGAREARTTCSRPSEHDLKARVRTLARPAPDRKRSVSVVGRNLVANRGRLHPVDAGDRTAWLPVADDSRRSRIPRHRQPRAGEPPAVICRGAATVVARIRVPQSSTCIPKPLVLPIFARFGPHPNSPW